jgi:hypothetical protein
LCKCFSHRTREQPTVASDREKPVSEIDHLLEPSHPRYKNAGTLSVVPARLRNALEGRHEGGMIVLLLNSQVRCEVKRPDKESVNAIDRCNRC